MSGINHFSFIGSIEFGPIPSSELLLHNLYMMYISYNLKYNFFITYKFTYILQNTE